MGGGLAFAGVLYLLVSVTAAAVVLLDRLEASSGPLLEVVRLGPIGIPEPVFAGVYLRAGLIVLLGLVLWGANRLGTRRAEGFDPAGAGG